MKLLSSVSLAVMAAAAFPCGALASPAPLARPAPPSPVASAAARTPASPAPVSAASPAATPAPQPSAPVRIDDAFASSAYACVSFTNVATRTAISIEFIVRVRVASGPPQNFTFMRTGKFSPGVPIVGPSANEKHPSAYKLANCANFDAPDDALDAVFSVNRVEFEDGSEWNAAPGRE